jgi:hypothetical protein
MAIGYIALVNMVIWFDRRDLKDHHVTMLTRHATGGPGNDAEVHHVTTRH